MKKTLIAAVFMFWALLIFYFSSQPYQDQDITPILHDYLSDLHLKEKLSFVSFMYGGREISTENLGVDTFVEFFIRKAAHLSIFFVWGFLTYTVLTLFMKKHHKVRWLLSVIFVILYAVLDEYHQSRTGNRTPLKMDVVLDTIGGIVGITGCWIIHMLRLKRKKHNLE